MSPGTTSARTTTNRCGPRTSAPPSRNAASNCRRFRPACARASSTPTCAPTSRRWSTRSTATRGRSTSSSTISITRGSSASTNCSTACSRTGPTTSTSSSPRAACRRWRSPGCGSRIRSRRSTTSSCASPSTSRRSSSPAQGIGALSEKHARNLQTLTDGWAAGLQLAAYSLRKARSPDDYFSRWNQAPIPAEERSLYGYLNDVVATALTAEQVETLVRIAACRRFSRGPVRARLRRSRRRPRARRARERRTVRAADRLRRRRAVVPVSPDLRALPGGTAGGIAGSGDQGDQPAGQRLVRRARALRGGRSPRAVRRRRRGDGRPRRACVAADDLQRAFRAAPWDGSTSCRGRCATPGSTSCCRRPGRSSSAAGSATSTTPSG